MELVEEEAAAAAVSCARTVAGMPATVDEEEKLITNGKITEKPLQLPRRRCNCRSTLKGNINEEEDEKYKEKEGEGGEEEEEEEEEEVQQ